MGFARGTGVIEQRLPIPLDREVTQLRAQVGEIASLVAQGLSLLWTLYRVAEVGDRMEMQDSGA
jgi:hypothetical protein